MPCIYIFSLRREVVLCGEVLHLSLLFVGEELSEQAKEEKVMRSPAVTTIKEMGYSEDRIKAAIFTLKQRLPRGLSLSGDCVFDYTGNVFSSPEPKAQVGFSDQNLTSARCVIVIVVVVVVVANFSHFHRGLCLCKLLGWLHVCY